MANKSKRKGTEAEVAVRDFLRGCGWDVERLPTEGKNDRGDIVGIPGVVVEVKNCVSLDLAGWVDEADKERVNADAVIAVVWHKRRGRASAGGWYVTMSGVDFVMLLEARKKR